MGSVCHRFSGVLGNAVSQRDVFRWAGDRAKYLPGAVAVSSASSKLSAMQAISMKSMPSIIVGTCCTCIVFVVLWRMRGGEKQSLKLRRIVQR